MNSLQQQLQSYFSSSLPIIEKRPNLYQIVAPFFHEDGDLLEVFIEPIANNRFRFCDYGLTLMHLSYNIKLTDARELLWQKILLENRLQEEEGNLYFECDAENLLNSFYHYVQALVKISGLKYFKRKQVKNLFYESLFEYIDEQFADIEHTRNYLPIPSKMDCIIDVKFQPIKRERPIFLFSVREQDNQKALEIVSSCLELRTSLSFQSLVVYENIDSLSQKSRNKLLRITDKPFLDLNQFRAEGKQFIKEAA